MDSQTGRSIYDHYESHLGAPIGRRVYAHQADWPSIQVLTFGNVFPHCQVFGSLGLSHYPHAVGGTLEVIAAVDSGWDQVPEVLATCLWYAVANSIPLAAGTAIGGVEKLFPSFSSQFKKDALYFTTPYNLPDSFAHVLSVHADILLGIFISGAEFEEFNARGPSRLEELLENANADPIALNRPSVA